MIALRTPMKEMKTHDKGVGRSTGGGECEKSSQKAHQDLRASAVQSIPKSLLPGPGCLFTVAQKTILACAGE